MKLRRDVFGNSGIAHSSLVGRIKAERFVDGTRRRVTAPVADLRLDASSPRLDRQILHGHPVCQLHADQSLCRDETSGYVGYINPQSLGSWYDPTHRVSAARTLAFVEPDFKAPNPQSLSCGSLLKISDTHGRYGQTSEGRWVFLDHLSPVVPHQPDLAATASLLLGTPYLWGGNSAFGIDCSGLIQLSCQAAGIPCPGDSDQQMDLLGSHLPEQAPPLRNDLMFWKGHVALVTDPQTLIHANAHHMAVAVEPISGAIARIESQGDGPCIARKRLFA